MSIAAISQRRAVCRCLRGLALLREQLNAPAIRTMFSMALWMTLIVAPVQALVGDMHGLNTLKHQPAKIAAMKATGRIRRVSLPHCCYLAGRIWSRNGRFGLEIPLSAA